jgi:hypothetical protein
MMPGAMRVRRGGGRERVEELNWRMERSEGDGDVPAEVVNTSLPN